MCPLRVTFLHILATKLVLNELPDTIMTLFVLPGFRLYVVVGEPQASTSLKIPYTSVQALMQKYGHVYTLIIQICPKQHRYKEMLYMYAHMRHPPTDLPTHTVCTHPKVQLSDAFSICSKKQWEPACLQIIPLQPLLSNRKNAAASSSNPLGSNLPSHITDNTPHCCNCAEIAL